MKTVLVFLLFIPGLILWIVMTVLRVLWSITFVFAWDTSEKTHDNVIERMYNVLNRKS